MGKEKLYKKLEDLLRGYQKGEINNNKIYEITIEAIKKGDTKSIKEIPQILITIKETSEEFYRQKVIKGLPNLIYVAKDKRKKKEDKKLLENILHNIKTPHLIIIPREDKYKKNSYINTPYAFSPSGAGK